MINRIDGSQPTIFSWKPSTGSPQTMEIYRSTLTGRRSRKNVGKRLAAIFLTVWSLVKIYFLFFIFDRVKETSKKQLKEINSFINVYFTNRGNASPNSLEMIQEGFGELSRGARKKIREKVQEIYHQEVPGQNTTYYDEQVDAALNNPFLVIKKEGNERDIHVMGQAILMVKDDLAALV